MSPRSRLGGPVGTHQFSVAAPGGSVGCQARDWATEAWCPAQPVSCPSLAMPFQGALLSCAAAAPGLPVSAEGGRFSCSTPHPPASGGSFPAAAASSLRASWLGVGLQWVSGTAAYCPCPCTAEAGPPFFCVLSPELGRMVRLSLFLLPEHWTGTPLPGFWGPLCWPLCPHPCVPAGTLTCRFW